MRFTPPEEHKSKRSEKGTCARFVWARSEKKVFVSFSSGELFFYLLFFPADVSRIRRAHRMVDIPQNLANIIPV